MPTDRLAARKKRGGYNDAYLVLIKVSTPVSRPLPNPATPRPNLAPILGTPASSRAIPVGGRVFSIRVAGGCWGKERVNINLADRAGGSLRIQWIQLTKKLRRHTSHTSDARPTARILPALHIKLFGYYAAHSLVLYSSSLVTTFSRIRLVMLVPVGNLLS